MSMKYFSTPGTPPLYSGGDDMDTVGGQHGIGKGLKRAGFSA